MCLPKEHACDFMLKNKKQERGIVSMAEMSLQARMIQKYCKNLRNGSTTLTEPYTHVMRAGAQKLFLLPAKMSVVQPRVHHAIALHYVS